jgi:CheY-like chemotaxis protein
MLVNLNVVRDGEEALCYLRRTVADPEVPRPTLILLDLNLPKKNGFEVLDEVKSDPVLRRIPVIVLTTSTAERDITKSYDLHANCYISKAARLENLIELLQSINSFWFQMVKYPTESGGIDE